MVKFSKKWTIDEAYRRLTSSIEEEILTFGDLPRLQRACIREIKALDSNLPNKLIPQIQVTSSVNGLLDTLTASEYWNWFDTRLLTAVAQASGSPEAVESLEKYKAIYYSRKISDLILCDYKIKPFKNFVPLVEKYKKDPSKLTILDLQKHQYEIEKVVEGGLALIEIKTGCVELTWQIPQELVYRAYTSMKRKHDELSSLAVKSLRCEAADELAGLPILWRGQKVGEVGPIEPLPEHVKQEPYSLPQGFHWVTLTSSNAEEVVKFAKKYRGSKSISNVENYIFKHLNTKSDWQFGIRTSNGKLVAITTGCPVFISIGGVSITCIDPMTTYHPKYNNKRLWYMLIKELMRRANLSNINHLVFLMHRADIVKPINTTHLWSYSFNNPSSSQLPSSPRTPGWRRMTSEDVPSVLALINKWSSQFEITRIFNSEEFSRAFLYPIIVSNSVFAYVVENETNNITDFVRFWLLPKSSLHVLATTKMVVSTKSSVKQLITDMLVCVKKTCAEVFGCYPKGLTISQHNIEPDVLSSLSFHCTGDCLNYFIYNYRYHEVPEARFWLGGL